MKATTKEFENKIEKAANWDEMKRILSELPKTTFSVKISELCDKYCINFSQIQIKTGITKSLFYSIVNGTRKPQKHHIIKIGLAMSASSEEINDLLKLAQHKELYAKNRDDAIILYGINQRLSVEEIEALLIESDAKLSLLEK